MKNQRTLKQNKSLHLYCTMLAESLNEAGISQKVFLRDLEVDNTPISVKEVFKGLARAKYLKDSTTELTTKEMMELYEEINRQTSKIGIYIEWPSEETRNFKEYYSKL